MFSQGHFYKSEDIRLNPDLNFVHISTFHTNIHYITHKSIRLMCLLKCLLIFYGKIFIILFSLLKNKIINILYTCLNKPLYFSTILVHSLLQDQSFLPEGFDYLDILLTTRDINMVTIILAVSLQRNI